MHFQILWITNDWGHSGHLVWPFCG